MDLTTKGVALIQIAIVIDPEKIIKIIKTQVLTNNIQQE